MIKFRLKIMLVDLLGGIPAPGGRGHGVGGPYRLGIDDGGGALGSRPAAARS